MKIRAFGILEETLGSKEIELKEISDTNELLERLNQHFPALRNMQFNLAVNRQIVRNNTLLNESSEIALLPPYSGG